MMNSTKAIGNPVVSVTLLVSKIPIITGKTTMAPKALVLGIAKRIPPINSATPTSGINQPISIKAPNALSNFGDKLVGIGI